MTTAFDIDRHLTGAVGPGAMVALPEFVPTGPAVVVTDRHLRSLAERVAGVLGSPRLLALEPGEPTVASVSALVAALSGDETLVAVGGGSVIDSAKLAAAVKASASALDRHLLAAESFSASLPVVAVPTTAGTGAEVTRTSVVSDRGHKLWAWDEVLRPAAVVADSDLTTGMPREVTVASGLDAVVHAMEAATAQRRDDIVEQAAHWALSLLAASLPVVVDQPGDRSARASALVASTAAGLAIDRCATGVGHGLGHALGSLVAIPHGLAVILAVWVAAEFNEGSVDPRLETVARALGANRYADAVEDLVGSLGVPDLLGRWAGERPLDVDALLAVAGQEFNAPMFANNVRPVDSDHLAMLAGDLCRRWDELGGRA